MARPASDKPSGPEAQASRDWRHSGIAAWISSNSSSVRLAAHAQPGPMQPICLHSRLCAQACLLARLASGNRLNISTPVRRAATTASYEPAAAIDGPKRVFAGYQLYKGKAAGRLEEQQKKHICTDLTHVPRSKLCSGFQGDPPPVADARRRLVHSQ